MNEQTAALLDILEVERLEVDLFRGRGDGGETMKRIFGGQVIAQALRAAYNTVEDRLCHSLHAYFIRPGDPSIPVIYEVDRSRDGGSFATRRVVAVQHGRQILNLAASFHKDEQGFDHQHAMPETPPPDGLPTQQEHRAEAMQRLAAKAPEEIRSLMLWERPVEIREVEPMNMFEPEPMADYNRAWFRVRGPVDAPPAVHHCMMAYASDMQLLASGNRPHGLSWFLGRHMGASLDHALWFHGPIQFDEWHLYEMESPWTGGARAFNRGKIFTRDGRLVASVAQEGLQRPIATDR